jgi:hypothetical protein
LISTIARKKATVELTKKKWRPTCVTCSAHKSSRRNCIAQVTSPFLSISRRHPYFCSALAAHCPEDAYDSASESRFCRSTVLRAALSVHTRESSRRLEQTTTKIATRLKQWFTLRSRRPKSRSTRHQSRPPLRPRLTLSSTTSLRHSMRTSTSPKQHACVSFGMFPRRPYCVHFIDIRPFRLLPPVCRQVVLHALWSYQTLRTSDLKALCGMDERLAPEA